MDDDDDEKHARKRKVYDFSVAEWNLRERKRQVQTWQRGIEYAINQAQLASISEEAYGIISHEVQEDEPPRPEHVDDDCTVLKIAREAYAEVEAEADEAAAQLASISEEAYGIISHEVQEDEPPRPEDVDDDCTLLQIAREAYAEVEAEAAEAAARQKYEAAARQKYEAALLRRTLHTWLRQIKELAQSRWHDPRAWIAGVEGGSASNASPCGGGAQRQQKKHDVEIMGPDGQFHPVSIPRVRPESFLPLYRPDTLLKQENGLQYVPDISIRGSCAYCSAEQTAQQITYICVGNPECVCVIQCCEPCCMKMRDLSAQVVLPADDDVTTADLRKNPFGARKNECIQCKSKTLEMMPTSLSVKEVVLKPLKTNDGLRIGFRCHTCSQYAVNGRLLIAMNVNHICGGVHVVCDTCCKEKYDPDHVQQISCNVPACKRSCRLTTVTFQEGILSGYSQFTIDDQPITQPVGAAAGQP